MLQNSSTLLLVQLLKLPSSVTPFLFSNLPLAKSQRTYRVFLSHTYKTLSLSTAQPAYLHNLIFVQLPGRTRSSSLIIITRPPSSSSLKITDHSFWHASPSLWNNKLPASFRQRHSSSLTTITPSITSSLLYSRLKTHLFHKSLPS